QPGHRACEQEEDRWFTTYPSDERAREVGEQLHVCQEETTKKTAKEPAKEVSLLPPKRINESSQKDDVPGDSDDSGFSFSENSLRKKKRRSRVPQGHCTTGGQSNTPGSDTLGAARQATKQPGHEWTGHAQEHAHPVLVREQEERDPHVQLAR